MVEVTQEQEQAARGSIRHKPQLTTDQRIDAVTTEVKRVADAIESLVAAWKGEIERTRR